MDFETNEFVLACTLTTLGFRIDDLKFKGVDFLKATFVFKDEPALQAAVTGFWGNTLSVEPRAFYSHQRQLRERLDFEKNKNVKTRKEEHENSSK